MKKIMRAKRGVWQLLLPLLSIWWIWVILLVVIFAGGFLGWLALKAMIPWLIFIAIIGVGIYLLVHGNVPWGFVTMLLGIGMMFASAQGYIDLSWFQEGSYNQIMADINVDHENDLHYSVFNARSLEGTTGLFAVFIDDEFKRADYFCTGTTHNKYPYKNLFSAGFRHEIDLEDNLSLAPGEHSVRVYYEMVTHRYDTSFYTADTYWNYAKCNLERPEPLSLSQVRIDQDSRQFNHKWLPCSHTRVKEKEGYYRAVLPENVMCAQRHFSYDTLNADEIEQLKTAQFQEFNITITDEYVPPDPICVPGNERCDGEIHLVCNSDGSAWVDSGSDTCKEEESWWDKFTGWLGEMFGKIQLV